MIRGLPGKIRLSLRSPLAIFSSLSRTTTTITEEEARGRDKFLPILPGGVEPGNSPFLHHPLFLTTPLSLPCSCLVPTIENPGDFNARQVEKFRAVKKYTFFFAMRGQSKKHFEKFRQYN